MSRANTRPEVTFVRSVPDATLRANIRATFAQATRQEIREGKRWYQGAHRFARQLAREYFLETFVHAAGVVAALSPGTSWEFNVKDAAAVAAAPTGERVTVTTYRENLVKAIEIRDGAHPRRVLGRHKQSGQKVRAFFENIARPRRSTAVCLDRHAVSLACGRVVEPTEVAHALRAVGVYERFAAAYRDVAAEHGLLPHQLQAITWLTWRRLKQQFRSQHREVQRAA